LEAQIFRNDWVALKFKKQLMAAKEEIKEAIVETTEDDNFNEIVLFNDDVNTFDHVIETLVATCNHSYEQAEQCSILGPLQRENAP